jgi:hypothetical protein
VAPGATSPVSSAPSFNLTRCMTVSLFLNVTIIPPKAAGFGENDREPLLPVIEMATGVAAVGDGPVGLLELDPPPQFHAVARIRPAAAAGNIRNLMACILSQSDGFETDEQAEYQRKRSRIQGFWPWGLTRPVIDYGWAQLLPSTENVVSSCPSVDLDVSGEHTSRRAESEESPRYET